jgi:hypothetical protein
MFCVFGCLFWKCRAEIMKLGTQLSRTYSRAEVIAAITQKGLESRCESCGKSPTEWTLPGDDVAVQASLVLTDTGEGQGLSVLPSVPLICNNCGHTRIYNLEYLMKGLTDG